MLNTVPLPRAMTAQLVDHRSRAALGAAWRQANVELLRLAERYPSTVVIDLDPLLAQGVPAVDPRLHSYARAHLSTPLLTAYAREIGHLGRQVVGALKKCLVLDLDDTLWGGVLGEDGVDGIELSGTHRGDAFTEFQRVVKQLGSQGVLLAVVSKNDQELVDEALRSRAEMVLHAEDFVRIIANWRPKHDNLMALADALNIGVDSLVFVDDSAFECGLVRHELPRVAVVQVGRDPALHIGAVLADGWFDVRELTREDRTRPAAYRDELARKDFLDGFASIEDYLAELGVEVVLAPVAEPQVARTSQMTLRTNQFNLTTTRLQPAEVRALLTEPKALTLAIRSGDRFGDNGLVGAIFCHRDGDVVHVDNMLLSCRVFARGIEQACLSALLRHARATGATEVRGTYRPTAKNGGVRDFYPRSGFRPVGDDSEALVFRHDLADIGEVPTHVRLIDHLEGMAW